MGKEVKEKVTKEVIEELKKEYEAKLKKRQKERWKYIINKLSHVLTHEGRIVQRTGNDFFGRSWERGDEVVIVTKDNKRIELQANRDISYQDIFPWTHTKTRTDKTFREQLIELIIQGKVNEDDEIIFNHIDYEDKTYNRSWRYEFKVKDILIYLYENKVVEEQTILKN